MTVGGSGTLAGTGSISSGANTITINGTLSPGAAAGNTGRINLATASVGTITLSSTSVLLFDLVSPGSKDLVTLGGSSISLGGGTLQLNLANDFDYDSTYIVLSDVSSLSGSGFGTVTGHDSSQWSPVLALNGSSYQLAFTPVPEPGTWVTGLLAAVGIVAIQRRRRREAALAR